MPNTVLSIFTRFLLWNPYQNLTKQVLLPINKLETKSTYPNELAESHIVTEGTCKCLMHI